MLRLENIIMDFGGLRVLDEISFGVEKGIISGLIGPNGAGKTTLFNIVSGLLKPTSGKVLVDGADITRVPACRRADKGISRTFQNIRVFGEMTLLENVLVGMHRLFSYSSTAMLLELSRKSAEEKQMKEKAVTLLSMVNLSGKADEKSGNLSYGEQRKLELARALATEPSLLLLDEPAAGMNPSETAELMNDITAINRMGHTICMIEHDMKVIMGICSMVTVLNFGKLIAQGRPEEIRTDPAVIEAYLGRQDNDARTA